MPVAPARSSNAKWNIQRVCMPQTTILFMRIEPSTLLCVSEKLKSFVRNIEIVNLFAPPQTTHSVPLSSIVTKPFLCSGGQHQLQLTWIPTTNHQSIHIFFFFFLYNVFSYMQSIIISVYVFFLLRSLSSSHTICGLLFFASIREACVRSSVPFVAPHSILFC